MQTRLDSTVSCSKQEHNQGLVDAYEGKRIIWLKRRVIVVEIQNHFNKPVLSSRSCPCKSAAVAAIYS